MMKKWLLILCSLALAAGLGFACSGDDEEGGSDPVDPDGDGPMSAEWPVKGTYAVWCDPDTDLCWQNPQRLGWDLNDDIGLRTEEAVIYCDELVLGGHDDWRLPTAREARSIVAGYAGTAAGGSCKLGGEKDEVTFAEAWGGGDCGYGESLEGPGDNGCYTKPGILGTCNKVDIYSFGHEMEFFASDRPSDDDPNNPQVATVMYDNAAVVWNHHCTLGEARCVRSNDGATPAAGESGSCTPDEQGTCSCEGGRMVDGYRFCNEAGDGWSPCDCADFTPTDADQPECHAMTCAGADKVRFKITVDDWNESLDDPTQLILLWYTADGWSFPQARPPEGGTWYNQIVNPGLPPYDGMTNAEGELVLEVPGCTYYQERQLFGDFYMMAILQIYKKFPPIPIRKDYWWGYDQVPTTFPFNGVAHTGEVREVEINLTSAGDCPQLCPSGEPNDDDVITCRYESIYTTDNCADFLASEWDEAEVEATCKGMQGADASTVTVTKGGGQSCLVTNGGCGVFNRCKGIFADGRALWAYGVPDTICAAAVPSDAPDTTGEFDDGTPFCTSYE
jgi:hypothetical protein